MMTSDGVSADARGAPVIDIAIDDVRWNEVQELGDLARRAVGCALGSAENAQERGPEVSLVFTNDAAIAVLNEQYRGKPSATNVLSFPSGAPLTQGADVLLGDVVVSFETINSESQAQGKSFENHLCHLIVHGVLHLLGYDHQTDSCAASMEALEISALAQIGVPNPYESNSEVNPPTP